MNEAPFQYRLLQDEMTEEEAPFQFRPLVEEPQEESMLQSGLRAIPRTAARVGETLTGLPGDIRDATDALGGFVANQLRKVVGKDPLSEEQQQQVKQQISGGFASPVQRAAEALPGSQDVKEKVKEAFGESLEPQTELEKFFDDVVEDFTALSIGGAQSVMRRIGTSVVANAGKEVAKEFDVGEGGQALTKAGIMLMTGFLGKPNASQYSKNLYKKAYDAIPEGEMISGEAILKDIGKVKQQISKGGITPDKQKPLSLMTQLEKKIKSGKGFIEADEIPAYRRSVNQIRFGKDRLSASEHKYLNDFDNVLNKHLLEYGNNNQTFLKNYRDANQAFAGIKQSNKIGNFISRKIPVDELRPETLILLGVHNPQLIQAGAGGFAMAKAYQLLNRFGTNPVLRKHYFDVIKAATKENATATTKALAQFEKAAEREGF